MSSRGKKNIVEHLMGQGSLGALLAGKKASGRDLIEYKTDGPSFLSTKGLSPIAESVVSLCTCIILLSSEELCNHFEEEVPESAKHPSCYARNLLEYACFKALAVATQVTDYLSDKSFRRQTFDMMVAWETPRVEDNPSVKVDLDNSIGQEAFVRLAPAIPSIADTITVHSQFDALTTTSRDRLSFSVYDKFLGELDRTIKAMKIQASPSQLANLQLAKGEIVIELEGTVTTQPVLEHIGTSAWPGRLTLTDHALYFKSVGVVSNNKCKKMDLSSELSQTVKPELTGPWGTRIFDKAISYKSRDIPEPILLEFPELTGHARRDYWMAITCEIIAVHHFIRKFQLDASSRAEAISRAVLGIARLRATRETIRSLPPQPELLLIFSGAEKVPGGDLILSSLAQTFRPRSVDVSRKESGGEKQLTSLGFPNAKEMGEQTESSLIGGLTPLEKAVLQSRDGSKRAEIAQASIDEVKVEGIDTNVAVLTELLKPFNTITSLLKDLVLWKKPFKTSTFLIFWSYIILRNLVGYVLPFSILCLVIYAIWFKKCGDGNEIGEIEVPLPPRKSKVEQLLVLQEGLSSLEEFLHTCNIFLLKGRALLFSKVPKATDQMAIVLTTLAFIIAIFPLKFITLLMLWEVFTMYMPLRLESTLRQERRLREWWYSVPVVSVHLTKTDENKDKKKR